MAKERFSVLLPHGTAVSIHPRFILPILTDQSTVTTACSLHLQGHLDLEGYVALGARRAPNFSRELRREQVRLHIQPLCCSELLVGLREILMGSIPLEC